MHSVGLQIIPSAALQLDHFLKWMYKTRPPPPPLFFLERTSGLLYRFLRAKLNKNWDQRPDKPTQIKLGQNKLSQIGRAR